MHAKRQERATITMLIEMVAAEHRAGLRQAAERSRSASAVGVRQAPAVEIRNGGPEDADVVWRLAALDEAPPLEGPVLIASSAGRAVAALSLADQRVVADPFVATAQTVSLLKARAEQLANAKGRRRLRWRFPRLRLA